MAPDPGFFGPGFFTGGMFSPGFWPGPTTAAVAAGPTPGRASTLGIFPAGFYTDGMFSPGFWTGENMPTIVLPPAPTGWASTATRLGPDPASSLGTRFYGLAEG